MAMQLVPTSRRPGTMNPCTFLAGFNASRMVRGRRSGYSRPHYGASRVNLSGAANATTGQVYSTVIAKASRRAR